MNTAHGIVRARQGDCQKNKQLKNFMFIAVTLLQTVLSSIAITKHGLTNENNPFRWAVPDPTLNMPNYHIQVAEL